MVNHKCLLYFCESAACLLYSPICCIFKIPHINHIIQCLSLSIWLISLIIRPSMLLQVATFYSFLWLNSIPLCVFVCVCVCVSISSSFANGHLGCIHILINNASVNIGVYMSFWASVSVFYIHPEGGIARSYDSSIFSFLRKLHTVKDYIFKDLKDYICCDLMSSKRTSCPKSIMLLHHATLKLSFEAATLPILPILYSFNIASWSLAPPPSPNKNSSSRRPKAVSSLGWAGWADWQWVLRRNSAGEGEEQVCGSGSLGWSRKDPGRR